MVTVALVYIILILSLYIIKTYFTLFFFSPLSPEQHQHVSVLSPCFIPDLFLSSSLFVCFSQLLLILITMGKNVTSLGVLQPHEEGGSTWSYLYWQILGQISPKRYGFFSLRFQGFFFLWFRARFLGVSLNGFTVSSSLKKQCKLKDCSTLKFWVPGTQ